MLWVPINTKQFVDGHKFSPPFSGDLKISSAYYVESSKQYGGKFVLFPSPPIPAIVYVCFLIDSSLNLHAKGYKGLSILYADFPIGTMFKFERTCICTVSM